MLKNTKIIAIIAILTTILMISVISSVSACIVYEPNYEISHGTKHIDTTHYKGKIKWETYKYNDTDKIGVYKEYKTKNKKNNKYVKGSASIFLEKINKKHLKVTTRYSTGPNAENIKYIKTKLSAKNYYWKVYDPKYLKKLQKPMVTKTEIFDHGKKTKNTIIITENKTKTDGKGVFTWKTYKYSNYPQILIKQSYINKINSNNPTLTLNFKEMLLYDKNIDVELKKISKNKLKLTIKTLPNYFVKADTTKTCTSKSTIASNNNDKELTKSNSLISESTKVKYVKTTLSAKQYYTKIYKNKMISDFLDNMYK